MEAIADPQQRWMPESILVDAGEGRPPIDIAKCLADDQDELGSLVSKSNVVKFPVDVYPPIWSRRKDIELAVKVAVSNADNVNLTVFATAPNKCTTLACDMAYTYRPPKDGANEIQNNLYENRENLPRLEKEGTRQDRMIDKKKANRLNGQSKPQRTFTEKPPSEERCPFRIRLLLDPGKCWYISPWSGCRCHKFHSKLPTGEKRRRLDTCTNKERRDAAIYAQQGSAGVAAGIIRQQSGNYFSQSQIRHNKITTEIQTGQVPPPAPGAFLGHGSSAEQCMQFLEKERREGKKSYIAVYHRVTDTVLQTMYKGSKKKRKNQQAPMTNSDDQGIVLDIESSDGSGSRSTKSVPLSSHEEVQVTEFLFPIRDRLTVGQKILLGVVWVREDERRLFELFPEVLMLDITFGTNSEGRPLAVTACFDAFLRTFTPIRAFLPSECQWVFLWIWSTAIPALLGKENCRRIQLVLTDGDSKIYNPFNSVKDWLYVSAIHGLCIFHLLTQPLGKLPIHDRADITVKGMIKTFKLWILSWTGLGGVENDDEFAYSHNKLREWLDSFLDAPEKKHRDNAAVLEVFLTMKIMPHKTRLLFAGRERRMTLDQKATSALESINQTIKVMAGKKVTPNMSLRESLRTMDTQVEYPLAERHLRACRQMNARSLYVLSRTSNIVTTPCESQIGQQTKQSFSYACRVKSKSTILFKHLPGHPLFCVDCDTMNDSDTIEQGTDQVCCPRHSATSPIPRFLRIRSVDVISVDEDGQHFEIRCSCLYHPTFGIPCRHIIAILFPVLPHHVFVRWHTQFFAYYKQRGREALTAEFDEKKRELRLIITREEYDVMMANAHKLEATHKPELPDNFWMTSGPSQRSSKGLVPLEEEDVDNVDAFRLNPFGNGLTTQEIGLSQCQEEENETSRTRNEHLPPMVTASSDLYSSCQSTIGSVLDQVRISKDPDAESFVRKKMAELQRGLTEHFLSKQGGQQDGSEYVLSHPQIDRRKKSYRLKSASERTRTRNTDSRGVRGPAKLDAGSLVPSDT